MDEINDGFVTHLKKVEEQERKKQLKAQPKLLGTEARALRRRKMKQMETLRKMASGCGRAEF